MAMAIAVRWSDCFGVRATCTEGVFPRRRGRICFLLLLKRGLQRTLKKSCIMLSHLRILYCCISYDGYNKKQLICTMSYKFRVISYNIIILLFAHSDNDLTSKQALSLDIVHR